MQIELTETERACLAIDLESLFNVMHKMKLNSYNTDSMRWRLMSKLDKDKAAEMYHDIELEYGRPPQIQE